jgi:heme exporter protein A
MNHLSAVDLDEVALRLGRTWALRGVSLQVPPGELVAILGHNGSGKTSLLRVVSTALRPTRGTARVLGYDVVRQANDVREHCAMLTHGAGLYGDLTAAENLEFAQRMGGDPVSRAAIGLALERVGLSHAADQRVRTFSSGMQRRAALARLFLRIPAVLLLDEPYNSLDPQGRLLVDALLRETRARGGLALVVLHDLAQSGVDFSTVVEMKSGRVECVFNTPVHGDDLLEIGA